MGSVAKSVGSAFSKIGGFGGDMFDSFTGMKQKRAMDRAKKDEKKAKKEQDAAQAAFAQEQSEQERIRAESTPFGSMSASSRIAAEKTLLARRASGGGSSAKSRSTNSLG